MRVFLFTLFVSLFIGISLYTAIWYTKTYLSPPNPLDASVEVGHLGNLFAAEKVSDTSADQDEDWEWEEESPTLPATERKSEEGSNRGISEAKAPAPAKKKKPKGTPRGRTDTSSHDFGSIDEGDVITHYFTVSNKGNAPLKITDFQVGCGCTMVDYPRKSIAPGASVKIKAVFDSKDKLGPQNKLVRLVTNGVPKNLDMHFRGYVYPKNFPKASDEEKEKAAEGKKANSQPSTPPDSLKKAGKN